MVGPLVVRKILTPSLSQIACSETFFIIGLPFQSHSVIDLVEYAFPFFADLRGSQRCHASPGVGPKIVSEKLPI